LLHCIIRVINIRNVSCLPISRDDNNNDGKERETPKINENPTGRRRRRGDARVIYRCGGFSRIQMYIMSWRMNGKSLFTDNDDDVRRRSTTRGIVSEKSNEKRTINHFNRVGTGATCLIGTDDTRHPSAFDFPSLLRPKKPYVSRISIVVVDPPGPAHAIKSRGQKSIPRSRVKRRTSRVSYDDAFVFRLFRVKTAPSTRVSRSPRWAWSKTISATENKKNRGRFSYFFKSSECNTILDIYNILTIFITFIYFEESTSVVFRTQWLIVAFKFKIILQLENLYPFFFFMERT